MGRIPRPLVDPPPDNREVLPFAGAAATSAVRSIATGNTKPSL